MHRDQRDKPRPSRLRRAASELSKDLVLCQKLGPSVGVIIVLKQRQEKWDAWSLRQPYLTPFRKFCS